MTENHKRRVSYNYSREEKEEILTDPWLSDREREVFVDFYMRGWNISKIAADLDVCDNTVDNILHRIRKNHPPKSLA